MWRCCIQAVNIAYGEGSLNPSLISAASIRACVAEDKCVSIESTRAELVTYLHSWRSSFRHDEDWYVQTPANASLKAMASSFPEFLGSSSCASTVAQRTSALTLPPKMSQAMSRISFTKRATECGTQPSAPVQRFGSVGIAREGPRKSRHLRGERWYRYAL